MIQQIFSGFQYVFQNQKGYSGNLYCSSRATLVCLVGRGSYVVQVSTRSRQCNTVGNFKNWMSLSILHRITVCKLNDGFLPANSRIIVPAHAVQVSPMYLNFPGLMPWRRFTRGWGRPEMEILLWLNIKFHLLFVHKSSLYLWRIV